MRVSPSPTRQIQIKGDDIGGSPGDGDSTLTGSRPDPLGAAPMSVAYQHPLAEALSASAIAMGVSECSAHELISLFKNLLFL